jgi:hypothetical protein
LADGPRYYNGRKEGKEEGMGIMSESHQGKTFKSFAILKMGWFFNYGWPMGIM